MTIKDRMNDRLDAIRTTLLESVNAVESGDYYHAGRCAAACRDEVELLAYRADCMAKSLQSEGYGDAGYEGLALRLRKLQVTLAVRVMKLEAIIRAVA